MTITDSERKCGRGASRPILLLWSVLFVTLFSALVPLGPPASRTTGSAFSPATTSVAIKARANQPVILAPRVTPPPGDPPAAVLLMAAPATVPSLALALLWAVPTRAGSSPARAPDWRQPRAPPASLPVTP